MYKFFALIGVLLILLGVALFAMPLGGSKPEVMTRSAKRDVGVVAQIRTLAEQYNAPLSILFGAMSLYYSRKRYLAERARIGG